MGKTAYFCAMERNRPDPLQNDGTSKCGPAWPQKQAKNTLLLPSSRPFLPRIRLYALLMING
jgi:hypothetical protein